MKKASRKAWELLYAPMTHLDVGVEEWKELHEQMEIEWSLKEGALERSAQSSTSG